MLHNDCGFCKVITGENTAHKVFENDSILAFMDKHPIQPGHLLIIPKEHTPNFYDLEDGLYTQLMLVAKKLSTRVNEVMRPKKVGLIVAGFDVPHTHIHIVPMHDYHDITSKSLIEGNRANPTPDELEVVAQKLR